MNNKKQEPIFDLSGDSKGITISIYGKRNSGKSYLLVNRLLMSPQLLKGKFDEIYLIHPNVKYDLKYHKIQFTEVYEEFSQVLIEYITEKVRAKYEEDPKYRACLIMDDCVGSGDFKGFNKATPLDKAYYNSRHYGLSLITLSQRFKATDFSLRSQLDYVIFFKTRYRAEKKIIEESYGLDDKKKWEEVWLYTFQDFYDFMLIDTKKDIIYRNFNRLEYKNITL
jgi:hypothetical protein